LVSGDSELLRVDVTPEAVDAPRSDFGGWGAGGVVEVEHACFDLALPQRKRLQSLMQNNPQHRREHGPGLHFPGLSGGECDEPLDAGQNIAAMEGREDKVPVGCDPQHLLGHDRLPRFTKIEHRVGAAGETSHGAFEAALDVIGLDTVLKAQPPP